MPTIEQIVSLCKRRGFVYAGSEIYGGLASTYDYGPLGVELKNNIKKLWWKHFVHDRADMVGLDGGILLHPRVWEASGHIKNFKDALVECKSCHQRFRPDKLADASNCPDCGGAFTAPRLFSGMFKTVIGPVEADGQTTYLRPETAQAIFINFKNILDSTNKKIPFGIAQIGKAFRNEVTTKNFIFRTIEFEQMEIEYFIAPQVPWEEYFEGWLEYIKKFADILGLPRAQFFDHEIPAAERAFYSQRTIDMEYNFPFGRDELWAMAYRTDYDLTNHQKYSQQNLSFFNEVTKSRFVPHVLEPTFGVERTFLAVLAAVYGEETLTNQEKRVVLKLRPQLAPYKVAVFPLLKNKPQLVQLAKSIFDELKMQFVCEFDDNGNIGKRYRRQDEIGTPFCVTIDFDSLSKGEVTVRDRDTMQQERVARGQLAGYLQNKLK